MKREELRDFMNSKGLPMDFTITLSSRRHTGTRTIVLSELIEEYHQSRLKPSEISKNVPFKRKRRYCLKYVLYTIVQYALSSTFLGFALIFISIDLFGKTEFLSWQMFAQILIVASGVVLISNNRNNDLRTTNSKRPH